MKECPTIFMALPTKVLPAHHPPLFILFHGPTCRKCWNVWVMMYGALRTSKSHGCDELNVFPR